MDNQKAKDFIEELIELSKKHALSISHEDGQGLFEVTRYHESLSSWIRDFNFRDYQLHSGYMTDHEINKSIKE